MSAMANTTSLVTTVTKPATNPRDADTTPTVNIQKFCEEYYEEILPIIMDKVRQDRRKDVHTRLDFKEERVRVQDRLRYGNRRMLDQLGHRRQSAFDRLSETYSPSTTRSRPRETDSRDPPRGRSSTHGLNTSREDRPKDREHFRNIGESYDDSFSHSYRDGNRSRHMKKGGRITNPHYPTCQEVIPATGEEDPFTPRIRNFESSRRTQMPNNVKTYDGTWDSEDHVKNFQAAAQVEIWAMPTWCHMFNSTLIGAARVWFDELPPESIDRGGEPIEDFMKRFKVETGRIKGAPECMRISGFMHRVNNPELTKRLNERVPKTMEEMMIITTAFIRGEAAAASKKKGHTSWKAHDQTPKEILAAKASKFQPPPPMVTPVEKRSSNKFCDFHKDKGHSTDECMQLKKQIEELVRAGKLSHLIKEIKHGRDQLKTGKKETSAKDKPTEVAIGGTLSDKGRTELCSIRKKNLNIFSWQPSDMTRVPRWRMRVDFMDLNKACPQDCYPLSEIDWKVKSICGYPFKCFLDTYKGYHQIQLAESDEEKTTFHTGQGVYCYTKMPFGLKNAGATYQRLTDKAFESQIGWNIELNPKKCSVGVAEGIFLGYVVTPEGIKPCLDKTADVLQLPSPRTIKEVQSLNGKLASLNRFLSKSAKKSMPLFQTLKKCIKNSNFHWTAEAEQAFKQLKQHLSELPLLVAPKLKEELIIYLSAAYGAISAVLMTEKGTTSIVFLGTPHHSHYRPTHQASHVSSRCGRTAAKMDIMLGEHNITYRPRTSVKGQILADCLIEMPCKNPQAAPAEKTQEEPWTLFTDGSSCVDGFGAGLILTKPEGVEFTYALRFQFAASNNEAEYEALIAVLRIVARMGVKDVHVSVDSKLVANQVLGTYVPKEDNMVKYLKIV
nr:reverse transcriptase domain-containing protein [Tanacetum cinerariifolium]